MSLLRKHVVRKGRTVGRDICVRFLPWSTAISHMPICIPHSIVYCSAMSHSQNAASTDPNAHEDPSETARLALFAAWQIRNQDTAWYFGVAVVGLVMIFTFAHWSNLLFNKRISRSSPLSRCVRAVIHPWRRVNKATVLGGVMFQPGITLLALIYFGINAILTFHDRPELAGLTILAKRFGWYV